MRVLRIKVGTNYRSQDPKHVSNHKPFFELNPDNAIRSGAEMTTRAARSCGRSPPRALPRRADRAGRRYHGAFP